MDVPLFPAPLEIQTTYTGDALKIRQDGTGDGLTVFDGSTVEATFGASTFTFANPLDMSAAIISNIGNAGTDFTSAGGLSLTDDLDMTADPILNIGNAGTDFLTNGGLTLANAEIITTGGLTVTNGGIIVTEDGVDTNGTPLYLGADRGAYLDESSDDIIQTILATGSGLFRIITGNLSVGNGTPTQAQNGEDAYVEGKLEIDELAYLDGGAQTPAGTAQGIGFESWVPATVITSTNGALWTIPGSQKWLIKGVFCNVTTNFDCTGDDCQLIIGDDTDTDGYLVLADATLQAADTEGTGWPAGWQGFAAATIGAFLDGITTGFPQVAAQTIDIDIRDVSAGTDPTAGAATCYLRYTRFE